MPLLTRPDDLIDMDDANRPAGLDPYLAFGAADRRPGWWNISTGRRSSRARWRTAGWRSPGWQSKVDAFFIHVQGAARLKMTDGSVKRVTYAAKSGQRFTGIGRVLADLGEIPLEQVTMQSIRAWLARNPGPRRRAPLAEPLLCLLSRGGGRRSGARSDRRRESAADAGPLDRGRPAAAHFRHALLYRRAVADGFRRRTFRRLMIAQDTGSAIVGPARGDLFAGSGDAAGEIAGVVRNAADFYALLPQGAGRGRDDEPALGRS